MRLSVTVVPEFANRAVDADTFLLFEECARRQRARDIETGSCPGVYVVAKPGYFKVGRAARSMEQRIRNLQCGSPEPLEFLAILSFNPDDEKPAHLALGAFHARGEWFHMTDDSLEALSVLQDRFMSEEV
jgi:hypothetical protein